MEFVQLGDLEKKVLACGVKIPELEARDIAEQILSGLTIMHAQSFAHRVLKPQVGSRFILASFGICDSDHLSPERPCRQWKAQVVGETCRLRIEQERTDTTAYNTRSGTPSYMSPEVMDAKDSGSEYTNAVDIWATGCIIYRLVVRQVPFLKSNPWSNIPRMALCFLTQSFSTVTYNVMVEGSFEDYLHQIQTVDFLLRKP